MTLPQVKAQQSPKVKFEKVSDEEMQMKVYGPDTTAEAVILYDEGRSDVRYQVDKGAFMLTYERFVRIKILKQSGTDWGNFAVSLYSYNQNKEEISGIKGVTFNLEKGKIVKTELKKESISKERENKYWEKERLSLPVVKIGSVIDLRYTIHSPMLWNLRSWNFQYLIPVKWSQYEVEYPEYFNYNHSSMGYHVLNTQNHEAKSVNINYVERSETSQIPVGLDGNRAARKMENRTITYMSQIYSYSAKEVPALKAEPYLTTLDNYTTRIKFELAAIDYSKILGKYTSYTDSWNDIAKELLDDEEFGGQIKSANYAKEEIAGLIAGKKDDKQKVMALYSYIQHAIKYNGDETFSPNSSLRKVFNEKNGNSADVNLLLLAMLTEAGIEAYPVLMSTRSNGLISIVHPSLTDCNYVIVMAMINGAPILLDATEPNLQAGVLPFRCLNGTGRKIKREGVEEVNLTNARPTCYNVVNLEFKEGKFTGNILSRKTGLNAFDFRQSVKNAGGQKEYFEKLRNGSTDIQFDDYSFSNLDSLHLPVMIKYNISLRNESEPGADILYINPILVDRTTKNQFSLPTRVFPIDYGGVSSDIYQLNLIVPEGYKVEELPQSKTFALEGKSGSYNYQVKQTDNTISFSTRLTIDKTLFLPSEYKMLQEFFNIIVSKESEQIVLKKISL
jgi:hypothetical protein